MGESIRVVIADDSALMRKKISEILNQDPDIEVVAVTRNGREALKAVYNLNPDVVTLDVVMPELDGIETLGYIMSEIPTPCVMVSAFTKKGADETLKCLEFGAIDFVTKPGGVISRDIDMVGNEIVEKVKLAASVPASKLRLVWTDRAIDDRPVLVKPQSIQKVFAIASSTGGTQALSTLLPALGSDLAAAFLIVQHMPAGFTKSLSDRLNWQSKITVHEAEDGMFIKPGHAIIAKGGLHMEVGGSGEKPYIVLSDTPPRQSLKPNADIMMESVAKVFKERSVAVVLTGMGSDGTKGASAIQRMGGKVLVEDESSCVVAGMPGSVIKAGLADQVYPIHRIARAMKKMMRS